MNSALAWTSRCRGRDLILAASVPLLVAALSGCSLLPGGSGTTKISGTAGPAGVDATSAPSTAGGATSSPAGRPPASPGTTSATGTTGTTSTKGCPAGGTAIPARARSVRTADLDGDGRKDQLWLADLGSRRTLGVRTASGAGFSTTFSSAAPQAASAFGSRISGSSIILLDTGRSVQLYAVIGCRIVPSLNPQGTQYSFDKGFTGYGTGVGCAAIGSSGPQLAGYLAKSASGGADYDVTRTTVQLLDGGRRAVNGPAVTLGRGLSQGNTIVQTAMTVSCGSSPRVDEPQN